MTTVRTRLPRVLGQHRDNIAYDDEDFADSVLAVLRDPSDADVERVAQSLRQSAGLATYEESDRAAIRALVGGGWGVMTKAERDGEAGR